MVLSLLKKLLLFEKLRVHSPLLPDEVKMRLQQEFEHTQKQTVTDAMFSDFSARRYTGTWQGDAFKMYRKPPVSFGYVPAVVSKGSVHHEDGGTYIDVLVQMNPKRLLSALVLFAFTSLVLIAAGVVLPIFVLGFFLSPVIVVVSYISWLFAVHFAVRDVEQFFRRVLARM